jgi:8-oxo-dGTP diphosphatase
MENPTKLNVAVKAVITNAENKVLIVRESSADSNVQVGLWGFPGGKIDPEEPFEDGLKREVKEETGLEITRGEPLHVGEWWPRPRASKLSHHIVGIFFKCAPADPVAEVHISEEHDGSAWVTAETLGEYPMMSPDDEVIAAYFDASSTVEATRQ